MLKGRTGLTPNIICRLGLCLSIEEPGEPRSDSSGLSSREINRYTLLGEYDQLFVALLNTRHPTVGDDTEELGRLFIEHLHRGIALLANRLKAPSSLAELVTEQARH
jgi:DNA sulfur modification protein DndE